MAAAFDGVDAPQFCVMVVPRQMPARALLPMMQPAIVLSDPATVMPSPCSE
jgi:hypothetical protein